MKTVTVNLPDEVAWKILQEILKGIILEKLGPPGQQVLVVPEHLLKEWKHWPPCPKTRCLTWGEACRAMLAGKRVRRACWSGCASDLWIGEHGCLVNECGRAHCFDEWLMGKDWLVVR